ncbi:HlyD family type I secretion periplasmic adaptor subunit [Ramlibacter sp. PS3R-8]|uniref:HlyD family type I secretion periplasmic adaptor subunit n=1 Tax=Ramlibacter sp. PS3R-8 TaxID=3133437 RepID=UPI0030990D8D
MFASLRGALRTWRGEAEAPPEPGFAADAARAELDQEPLRARWLLRAFWLTLALGLAWASFTKVDEITRGEGRVIPSKQLQVLQSLDGGVVSEILVKEGQVVEAGQVLVNIDTTRFDSSVAENRSQYLSLLTRVARLKALADDTAFVAPPEAVAQTPKTADAELQAYQAARSALAAQLSVAEQQLAQRRQEIAEAQAKREQAAKAYQLTAQELAYTKPLIASGAVSEVDVLRLEREASRFLGERDIAAAQISKAQSAMSESTRKIQEITLQFRSEARKELSENLARLNASAAGSAGLADKVDKSVIRSPLRGTVKKLYVATVGGVVQPGKDIVEVVPLEETLLLDARVLAKDIAFLRPGAKAIVKFTAYDYTIYGGLEGRVEMIGADSVTDDKGNTFYMVRVRTGKSQLAQGLPIIPGMVAEVNILTGQKSVLAYLLKPVIRARQSAFTER